MEVTNLNGRLQWPQKKLMTRCGELQNENESENMMWVRKAESLINLCSVQILPDAEWPFPSWRALFEEAC